MSIILIKFSHPIICSPRSKISTPLILNTGQKYNKKMHQFDNYVTNGTWSNWHDISNSGLTLLCYSSQLFPIFSCPLHLVLYRLVFWEYLIKWTINDEYNKDTRVGRVRINNFNCTYNLVTSLEHCSHRLRICKWTKVSLGKFPFVHLTNESWSCP